MFCPRYHPVELQLGLWYFPSYKRLDRFSKVIKIHLLILVANGSRNYYNKREK